MVLCMSITEERKYTPPSRQEVSSCASRFLELESIASPTYFVLLGKEVQKHFNEMTSGVTISPYNTLPLDSLMSMVIAGGVDSDVYIRNKVRLRDFIDAAKEKETRS